MFHAWGEGHKRERRNHERNKKERDRGRQEEKWQGKYWRNLVSLKDINSRMTLVKGKEFVDPSSKKRLSLLFLFLSQTKEL